MNRLRLKYAFVTLLLLIIEVLIALFVHDSFVRPYLGDVLVVILMYFLVRIFVPQGYRWCRWLPIWIFLFATGVEVLQGLNLPQHLGLSASSFMSVLIGSVFDIRDIICYAVGTLLVLVGYELLRKRA